MKYKIDNYFHNKVLDSVYVLVNKVTKHLIRVMIYRPMLDSVKISVCNSIKQQLQEDLQKEI